MGKVLKKDFVKKKVKLGKKVAKKNETKIKLKTKKIHVPHQNSILMEESDINESESANRLVRQLHHYSEHHRVQGLMGIKTFLTAVTTQPDRYITLLFPEMFELIFKDDHETRDCLVETVTYTVQKLNAELFMSIMSVLITYLCSGLTNLNKSIRRDSMLILLAIGEKSRILIKPFAPKLLSHLMLILHDKTLPLLLNPETANGKKVKMSMFQLVLRNIGTVLLSLESGVVSMVQADSNNPSFEWNNDGISSSGAIIMIRSKRGFHDWNIGSRAHENISEELDEALFTRLTNIWRDVVSVDGSITSFIILDALRQMVRVLSILMQLQVGATISVHHHLCIQTLLMFFPFMSKDGAVSVHGSSSAIQGNFKAELLNIEICELAFHSLVKSSGKATKQVDDREYVFSTIQTHLISVLKSLTLDHESSKEDSNFAVKAEVLSKVLNCARLFVRENVDPIHVKQFMSHVVRLLGAAKATRGMVVHACHALADISNHLFSEPANQPSADLLELSLSGIRHALITISRSKQPDYGLLIPLLRAIRCSVVYAMQLVTENQFTGNSVVLSYQLLSQTIMDLITAEVHLNQQSWYSTLNANIRRQLMELVMYLDTEVIKKCFRNAVEAMFRFNTLNPSSRSELSCLLHILLRLQHQINYDCREALRLSLDLVDTCILPTHQWDNFHHFQTVQLPVVEEIALHVKLIMLCNDNESGSIESMEFIIQALRTKFDSIRDTESVSQYAAYSVVFCFAINLIGVKPSSVPLRELIMDCLTRFFTECFDLSITVENEKFLAIAMPCIIRNNLADDESDSIFQQLLYFLKNYCCSSFSVKSFQNAIERIRIVLCKKISLENSHLEVSKLNSMVKDWINAVDHELIARGICGSDYTIIHNFASDLINCF